MHRLAIEKLEAKAGELRPQWAWTKAVLDPEYRMLAQYARVEPKPAKVPADLAAELEQIETHCAEIDNMMEVEWDEELAAEGTKLEDRRAQIDEIIEGLAVFSKKDRKRAGCIVTIGDAGQFCLHQGLLDRSAATDDAHAGDDDQGEADDDRFVTGADDEGEDDVLPRNLSSGAEQTLRKVCGFSQSLVDDLKAHRLQITQPHLAASFEVAFDLAVYSLCLDLFDRFGYRAHPLELRATETALRSSLNDLTGTPRDGWQAAQNAMLELDWLKLPPAEGFAALAALPTEEKQRLFAWCIAATLKPQLAIEDRADPVIEAAGRRLNVGFEDYWRPTAANYWGRVKKAHGTRSRRGDPGQALGARSRQ